MNGNEVKEKGLKKSQVFAYSLGVIPVGLIGGVFAVIYLDFFRYQSGLDQGLFVIGMMIYAIVNMFNDPLIGQMSDKTNVKKWGSRRIVYIKYAGPLWCLIFAFMWFPWNNETSQILIFIRFVLSICAFDMCSTTVVICWNALLPEITNKSDEQAKISLYNGLIGLFGMIPILIVDAIYHGDPGFFRGYVTVLAIISAICFWILQHYSKERPELQQTEVLPLIESIKQSFKTKSFRFYIGYVFFFSIVNAMRIPFAFQFKYILGNEDWSFMLFILIAVVLGFISNIICLRLLPKWGIKKVIIRFGFMQMFTGFIGFIFVMVPILYEMGFIWIGFIINMIFSGYGVLNSALFNLSIDEDEYNHGTRREGMFSGINALFVKPAESLGPILGTTLLAFFLYDAEAAFPSEFTLLGIKILFYLVPNAIIIFSFIVMLFYPLSEGKIKEIKSKLEIIHEEKRKQIASGNYIQPKMTKKEDFNLFKENSDIFSDNQIIEDFKLSIYKKLKKK